MKPLWKFAQHGQSGRWASDLFPEIDRARRRPVLHPLDAHRGRRPRPGDAVPALRLDELHPPVDGLVGAVRPGHREREPARLRLASPRRRATAGRATTATPSCPPSTRARALGKAGGPPREATHPQPDQRRCSPDEQRRQFDLLRELNAEQLKRTPGDAELEAVVDSYELAWRMQTQRPGRARPRRRRRPRRSELYGIGEKATDNFGRQCLMARRLCEAGRALRPGDLRRQHRQPRLGPALEHAQARRPRRRPSIKPIAGLLADLKRRGLLEDTLVWWGGEFGRTPYAEKQRHRPRPQPRRLHRLAGRRRRQAGLRLRRDRRVRPPRRARTRSTCTTCTPPSCTCSASTTRS